MNEPSEEEGYEVRAQLDPRNLLPYERELEPHDPNVERLPTAYVGTDRALYGGDGN